MATTVRPFLMFQGNAEAATKFYVSLFPNAKVNDIERYGPGEAGPEGKVVRAVFSLGDQKVMCIDSPLAHAFTFTPSFSFFVQCSSEAELRHLASRLGEGGKVLMPLDSHGFSGLFTWLSDKYGVSWQLNLD